MRKRENNDRLDIRLPSDMKSALQAIAEIGNTDVADLVRGLIRKLIEDAGKVKMKTPSERSLEKITRLGFLTATYV